MPLLAFVMTLNYSQAHQPFVKKVHIAKKTNWEILGHRKVNYQLDRDEIFVTAREGRFNAVRLKIIVAPLNMHRCVIHFANGTKQEVVLKKRFGPGQSTRIIDIKGRRRVIKKVVFWYDTKGLPRGKARVELWGRHY